MQRTAGRLAGALAGDHRESDDQGGNREPAETFARAARAFASSSSTATSLDTRSPAPMHLRTGGGFENRDGQHQRALLQEGLPPAHDLVF